MDRLTRLLLGGLVAGLAQAPPLAAAIPAAESSLAVASPLDRWQSFIAEASQRFGIPEVWIRAVMRAESGGRTRLDGRPITSRAGAMGLMQLMPETWAGLRERYGLGADAHDPRDNILAGTAYLRELYDRYGYPNLFAAYNAGPARFDRHLFQGEPLPEETRAYLAMLGRPTHEPSQPPVPPSGNSLFFPLGNVAKAVGSSVEPVSGGLFIPLRTVPRQPP
ncbi:lytic transglycosylase domain-containing protein [Inquilinus limosus]|uniref:lytic transglycosylase domain-containing protein n=1 Tax=Inquilinus limosus TaxID=171674 RepID=UPI003F18F7AD